MFDLYSAPGRVSSYTWATKPATYPVGQPVFISNFGPKGSHWYYDGTLWKPLGGRVTMAALDADSASINNSETITLQALFPAGGLQVGDQFEIPWKVNKSGTTDTGGLRVRMGTAGTTADTQLFSQTVLIAANRQGGAVFGFRLNSATTVAQYPVNSGSGISSAYPVVQAAGAPADTTISNVSSATYVSVSILSSSTNDTVGLANGRVDLIRSPN